MAVNI